MSPNSRLRNRMKVVLHMVIAFVTTLLLAQLWLLTVTLEAMENTNISQAVAIAALVCSLFACTAVWSLIRFFLRSEGNTETEH